MMPAWLQMLLLTLGCTIIGLSLAWLLHKQGTYFTLSIKSIIREIVKEDLDDRKRD